MVRQFIQRRSRWLSSLHMGWIGVWNTSEVVVWAVGSNYCIGIFYSAVRVFRVGSWTKIECSMSSSGWLEILNTVFQSLHTDEDFADNLCSGKISNSYHKCSVFAFKHKWSYVFTNASFWKTEISERTKSLFFISHALRECARWFLTLLPSFLPPAPRPTFPSPPSALAFTCSLLQHLAPAYPACLLNFSSCTHFWFASTAEPGWGKRETTLRVSGSQKISHSN